MRNNNRITKPTIRIDIQLFTLHLIGICFHLNISLLNIDNTTFVKHCIIIVISWQITCSIPKKDLFLYWTLTHFVLLFSTKPRVFAY